MLPSSGSRHPADGTPRGSSPRSDSGVAGPSAIARLFRRSVASSISKPGRCQKSLKASGTSPVFVQRLVTVSAWSSLGNTRAGLRFIIALLDARTLDSANAPHSEMRSLRSQLFCTLRSVCPISSALREIPGQQSKTESEFRVSKRRLNKFGSRQPTPE